MKNTRDLILTNKDCYINYKDSIEIAHHIYRVHQIPATIQVTGKNKCSIKLDLLEIEDKKYMKLYEDMKQIGIEIYKTSKKHDRRIKLQAKNDVRVAEEMQLNHEMTMLNEEYPQTLC